MKCAGSGCIRYAEVWKGMKIVPYTRHLSRQCENKENSNYVTAFLCVLKCHKCHNLRVRVCAKSGKRKVKKMKKKKIEQIAAERLAKIEGLETLLGRRRQEIMQLKEEVQGLRELNGILEAMILQLVEDKGKAVISRAKLREGIGQSFSIKTTDEEFILSAERSEDIEQV